MRTSTRRFVTPLFSSFFFLNSKRRALFLSLSLSLPRVLSRKTERRRPGAVGCEGASPPRALVPHEALVFVVVFFPKRIYIIIVMTEQPNKGGTFRFFFEPGTRPDPLRSFYKFLFFDWFERSPKDGFFFAAAGGIFRQLKFLFSSKSRKKFKKKTHHTHTKKPMTD